MRACKITAIGGDRIGPLVISAGLQVLEAIGTKSNDLNLLFLVWIEARSTINRPVDLCPKMTWVALEI